LWETGLKLHFAIFSVFSALITAGCGNSKAYVEPAPHQYDGRYVGTRHTIYPKCSADLNDMALIVKDNKVPVYVEASKGAIPIDADGSFSGRVTLGSASGQVTGKHLSMELIAGDCQYRMELDKR
jgi:hypothetical protein